MTFWTVCSAVLGCGTVERPNAEICVVNAPALHRKCYNLARDFDGNGNRYKDAKPIYRPNPDISSLNKATLIDSETGFADGIGEVLRYIKELRAEARRLRAQCEGR